MCWAFASELWSLQVNPLKLKKHGRMPKSIFRVRFDSLRHTILNLSLHYDDFAPPLVFRPVFR